MSVALATKRAAHPSQRPVLARCERKRPREAHAGGGARERGCAQCILGTALDVDQSQTGSNSGFPPRGGAIGCTRAVSDHAYGLEPRQAALRLTAYAPFSWRYTR